MTAQKEICSFNWDILSQNRLTNNAEYAILMAGGMHMQNFQSPDAAFISKEHFYTGNSFADVPVTKRSFSEFFRFHLKKQSAAGGQRLTTRSVAETLGISYERFRKIVNLELPTRKRDCIIAVCAVLHADSTDTSYALHCCGMSALDESDPRDCLLMTALDLQESAVPEINAALTAQTFPPLDIISHRTQKQPQKYPYRLLRKHVQCTVGGIGRFAHPEAFLSLVYDPECFYSLRTCMEFDDNGRRYEICIRHREQYRAPDNEFTAAVRRQIFPPEKQYTVYAYPHGAQPSELHGYDKIEDTGTFCMCFREIENSEKAEKRRLLNIVNDTRNYGRRISARVIENELHIFCEEYNSDIPELSEYYLMDWCGGVYTLYIAGSSRFMARYLPADRYAALYGKPQNTVTAQYVSAAEIEDAAYEARDVGMYESFGGGMTSELRLRTYKRMKSQINALMKKLKAGTAQICDRAALSDPDLLYAYFGISADEMQDAPSAAELLDGFALGLRTVDEIRAFQALHGTLDLRTIL